MRTSVTARHDAQPARGGTRGASAGARRHRPLARAGLLALLGLLLAAAPEAAQTPHLAPPKGYYLALGDSLAFGFQGHKFAAEAAAGTYDPASFDTGYADVFARRLATLRPGLALVNYSCPGESAASFLAGGCPFHDAAHPLHDDYPPATPQLAAALAFLHAHRGQVSPITLQLGANDVGNLYFGPCHQDLACTRERLPATLAQVRADLDHSLGALRAAAPDSEIIVMQVYRVFDPVFAGYDLAVPSLNHILAEVAAAHGARVADGASPFTPHTICTLTFVSCTPPEEYDIHPTDEGYRVLAEALWAASGYDHLRRPPEH